MVVTAKRMARIIQRERDPGLVVATGALMACACSTSVS
jgi:hypothetical protein